MLPALTKAWEATWPAPTPASRSGSLLDLKNALKAHASHPWGVIGSCDRTTAAMDAVDRWIIGGDVQPGNTSPSAHSWIVLSQPSMGGNFQVLIALSDNALIDDPNNDLIIVSYSPQLGFGTANGGTDGGTTAPPTALDERAVGGTDWLGANPASGAKLMNIISATDGTSWRIIMSEEASGLPLSGLGFETVQNPIAGWTYPRVGWYVSATVASGVNCFTWEKMQEAEFVRCRLPGDSGDFNTSLRMVGPMFSTLEGVEQQQDDGRVILHPHDLFNDALGTPGRYVGQLPDLYWATRNPGGGHAADLDTFPAGVLALPANIAQFYEDTSNPISGAEITDAAQVGLDPLENITLETWVKLDSAVESILIDKYQTPIGSYRFYIQGGNLLKFQSYVAGSNSVIIQIAQTFTPGVWYHVAATRQKSDGALKLFVNGSQIGATEFEHVGVNLLQTNKLFRLGGGNNSSVDLKGFMAHTRVWSIVRTPAEILANMNVALVGNEAGLEGCWPLHTDFDDITANTNHLTAVAGNGTAPAIVAGTRPFAGPTLDPQREFVCLGDVVAGWLDDAATDLYYSGAPAPPITPAVFVSMAVGQQGSGNPAITISKPAGVQNGDLLIAFILSAGANNAQINTRPAGWVNKHAGTTFLEGSEAFEDCDVLTAGGAEPGSYTWVANGGSEEAIGAILCYRPAHGTQLDVIAGAAMGSSSTNHTAPNVTTIQDQALIVAAYMLNRQAGNTIAVSTPPAVMTNRVSHGGPLGIGRNDLGLYVYDESGPPTPGLYTGRQLIANGASWGYGITLGIRALNT